MMEYWKQLEEIRQQYHNDMKEIKKRMGKELKENADLSHRTYLVKRSHLPAHPDVPEEEALAQRGVKFEISLDKCTSEDDNIQENEVCHYVHIAMINHEKVMDKLNDTWSFEDGMKFQEYRPIKEHEDYTDRAFEELCGPEAEGCCFSDIVSVESRRRWDARAPQTLLQIMATADVTSTCPTMPDVGMIKPQLPQEDQEEAEIASDIVVDAEQLDPGSYGDIKCEESEDELRSEMIESLEKLAVSTEEREEAPSCSKDAEKPGEKERLNLPARNSSEGNDI
ncbi:hypothetical protein U0070_025788 [Myodes glareolus]|uniref:non-specific serine/threonine protein kinase n=1 Tax=Myodes glareolus TaxID=447135 RepID=A0AAW0J935_MYOGA